MKIINPNEIELLTPGERYTLEQKIRKIFPNDNCFVYVQPTINANRFDFIIIGETFGILIIEVKDWDDTYIVSANRNIVQCADGKRYKNPIAQISTYQNILESKLTMVDEFVDDQGDLIFPIKRAIFYVNLEQENLEKFADLQDADIPNFTKKRLRSLKREDLIQESTRLSALSLETIRGLFFPEIVIPQPNPMSDELILSLGDIRALDIEQEEFAKKVPNGHYMVSGIPGSGKTVILLSRALHLVQTHDEHHVLILTYTKALANKLRDQLAIKAKEMHIHDRLVDRIQVRHFHGLCKELVGFDTAKSKQNAEAYFNEEWPRDVIRVIQNKPLYDSVLVDEYQDFHATWFELCKVICRKNEEGNENIFFAGDRLQRIYNVSWNSYREIGINIVGRSKLLKNPYRTHQNHFDFALSFLAFNESLAKDINNFYEMENIKEKKQSHDDIALLEGSTDNVIAYVNELVTVDSVLPEDILILCHRNYECNELIYALPNAISNHFIAGKEPTKSKGLVTTYHSSKGLEAKYCILFKLDDFDVNKQNRVLAYVGMTRASEKLIIHFRARRNFIEELPI